MFQKIRSVKKHVYSRSQGALAMGTLMGMVCGMVGVDGMCSTGLVHVQL
jgi:hypothetical protein